MVLLQDGVSLVDDPVPGIQVEAPRLQLLQHRHVSVTQHHQVQGLVVGQTPDGPLFQKPGPGLLFLRWLRRPPFRLGHPPGQLCPQIRVKPAEGESSGPTPQKKAEDPIPQVSGPQTIPVGQEGPTSRQIHDCRIPEELHPDFLLQEAAPPPVVIPSHQPHPHPCVHQGGQSSQDAGVATGNDGAVLEPEVEEIAVDDHFGRVLPAVLEPGLEGPLRLPGNGSQVNVAGQVEGGGSHGGRR